MTHTPSLPPAAKVASVWAHTIVDVAAIAGIVALICLDKIDASVGLAVIALIAGVWAQMRPKNGQAPPPTAGLVLGLLSGVTDIWRP